MELCYDEEGGEECTRQRELPISGPELMCVWPTGGDRRQHRRAWKHGLEVGEALGGAPLTQGGAHRIGLGGLEALELSRNSMEWVGRRCSWWVALVLFGGALPMAGGGRSML